MCASRNFAGNHANSAATKHRLRTMWYIKVSCQLIFLEKQFFTNLQYLAWRNFVNKYEVADILQARLKFYQTQVCSISPSVSKKFMSKFVMSKVCVPGETIKCVRTNNCLNKLLSAFFWIIIVFFMFLFSFWGLFTKCV